MILSRRPVLFGAASAALLGATAYAQAASDFLGDWFGALDLGSQRLRLRLNVTAGPAATLFSIDQGDSPIPVGETRIDGDKITLAIPVIGATFEGRLANGRIEGQFTQRGALPLVFTRQAVAESAPPPAPLTEQQFKAWRAETHAPAFAAAARNRDGRLVQFVDGVRATGRSEAATTADKWHIGSITKSMTATLVARCVAAGAVSWTESVGNVLGGAIPEMRAAYKDVTLRHLLCHRAGLVSNLEWSEILSFPRENADPRADRIKYARLGLTRDPSGPKEEHFEYSNTGYVIAAAMLEAKLGAPWEALMRKHVFEPLGLSSAGFGAPGTPGRYDQPVGHGAGIEAVAAARRDAPVTAFPPGAAMSDNPAVLGPAGRVHASLADMLTYLDAHRDRSALLPPAQWDMLHTPPFGGPYAMGWAQRGGMLWHNGSNTLWYMEAMFDRARGVSAIAATNDGRVEILGPVIGKVLVGVAQSAL